MAILCLLNDEGAGIREWGIGDKPVTVGRGAAADLQIDDEGLSRRHFVIYVGVRSKVHSVRSKVHNSARSKVHSDGMVRGGFPAVPEWGSASMSRSPKLQFAAHVVRLGPIRG